MNHQQLFVAWLLVTRLFVKTGAFRVITFCIFTKRVQNLLSLDVAMSSVQEKFTQLESSIEQRLKWAAGANPSLNPILENFERTLKDRKRLIVVSICITLS